MLSEDERRDETGRIGRRQPRSPRCLRALVRDAVDPAAMAVAHRRLVRVARAVAVAGRRRVVLRDEVVPVGHPHGAVGPDLRVDGRHPLLGAGQQVVAVARDEAGPGLLHHPLADEVGRGFGDEGDAVPVGPRERARRVELVPGRGGVAAVHVDLADVRRDEVRRIELRRALVSQPAGRTSADAQPVHTLEVPVGDRDVEAGVVVGRRSEDVERLGEAESPRVVGRPGHELEAGSIGPEPVHTLRELHRSAVHLTGETGVAHRAPDVVVGAVEQVRRAGVAVADPPARAQHRAAVGLVVAVGVLEQEHVRGGGDDDAPLHEDEARGEVESLGEDGPLVGASVAVGVLENRDAVGARVAVQHEVGVVDGFDHPEAPPGIERERDGLDDVGLAREQLEVELGRHGDELHRVGCRERHLVLRRGIALLVVRHVEAVEVDDLGHPQALPRLARRVGDRPARALLDELLETRLAPRALVVPVRRVEHAALALRPHPRVRLAALLVDAFHQDRAIDRVVSRVDVGLVPRREGRETAHGRVVRRDDLRAELPRAVRLELAADKRDVARRFREHGRRAVQRHQPLAALDELDEGLLLRRRQRLVIGVDHQRVVMRQDVGPQRLLGRRHVGQLDALAREGRREDGHQGHRRVVRARVPEEEHSQDPAFGTRRALGPGPWALGGRDRRHGT